jgi:hypothetical protein
MVNLGLASPLGVGGGGQVPPLNVFGFSISHCWNFDFHVRVEGKEQVVKTEKSKTMADD